MGDDRQHENGRHKMEYYRGARSPVNSMRRFSVLSVFYLTLLDLLIGLVLKRSVGYGSPASSKGAKCTSYEQET